MAPGGTPESAGADGWRRAAEPWLAAVASALSVVAAMGRPALRVAGRGLRAAAGGLGRGAIRVAPHLRRGAAELHRQTGRVVDATARAVVAATRALPQQVSAVEATAVPVLAAAARRAGHACGWLVDRSAVACTVAARGAAAAAGTTVHALAGLTATGGRLVGPRLPGAGRVAVRMAAAGVVVLGVGAALGYPALRLAVAAVDLDVASPGEAIFPPMEERSTVRAADGSVLAILHGEIDRRVVPLDQIPDHVQQAVITAEDRRFREHEGYDLEAIGRAFWANVRARGLVQGGSTITQQLAKQNYVGDDRVLTRKVNELVHAIALEEEFTKDQLLERYLNQVYFGAGAYGIAAAAEHFFAVAPEQLTVEQAALLAGMIRSPSALDPRSYPEAAKRRRDEVLAGMEAEGYLPDGEAAERTPVPVKVVPATGRQPPEPYVVEAVKREFLAEPAFGDTRAERVRRLFAGGLEITTTIDPQLQTAATQAVQAHLPGDAGPTAAVAVVDPVVGAVRALHSGTDFAAEQFDIATQGRRQPGSAFKPFVLAAALEQDGMPAALRGESPAVFSTPGMPEPWRVENFGGRDHGTVGGHQALVRSVNTAFADLAVEVGVDAVADVAGRLGIDVEEALGPVDTRGPSIALGGLTRGVSPLEMASAYGTFANDGIHVRPYLIERVVDATGEDVLVRQPRATRALDEDDNDVLLSALQDVVRRGTGTRARLAGWQPLGKTGTTQNSADAWFVGAVPRLSAAVWVGHPEERVPIPGLTGGSLPAPIWRAFMVRALDGATPVAFDGTSAGETTSASSP